MRKLDIFDTTLRDGEQSLEKTLNACQKLELAKRIAKLGVNVIEAGFPASSPGDFAAVQKISEEVKGVSICGLSRCVQEDIDCCVRALSGAENPRINLGLAVSPIHMEKKLKLTSAQAMDKAVQSVKYARKSIGEVQFYAEDALRSEFDFLVKILEQVINAGATTVTISDTVGIATPWQLGELVARLKNTVINIDRAKLSIHCHNDLGMATANSLAGILAGADQIEGTITGIGERAGNASLEEVIMALYVQKELYSIDVSINMKEIFKTSKLISMITGVPISRYKPVVGSNAFWHAAGIHQDGMIKEAQTYQLFDPGIIGAPESKIVLNARSGRSAVRYKLQKLGHSYDRKEIENIYHLFLRYADEKSIVTDEEFNELLNDKRER
ncbi:2-isopropylmalate synthase [Syntrophobotulus glycolicus DSM 8271]|uniref:2-isopropylmalate synthase n=1 Tax=Syntrophobotulus glycolicus (strain DSM 8271 / FlGlyR) TaxID=645991 RepID=F0SYJ0_SYNGF|nr:2-isopropylmalate synthase [Syntrophobotulus glycolicus]ADY57102.1 2-isopropylmalate synthase [Syntrophobotulus glycolicus DSM 8271]